MRYKAIISFFAAMLMAVPVLAETNQDSEDEYTGSDKKNTWELRPRIGYNIGGTAPMDMPASIRSVDAFYLKPSFMLGCDVKRYLIKNLALSLGLYFEWKDMDSEVSTKGYRMQVKMDEDEMEGFYTGHVRQKVHMAMFTLPLLVNFDVNSRLTLKAGPYVSWVFNKDFSGYAFDGYLRKDTPTGAKVVMGDKEGEWATYEFPDEVRSWQAGVALGLDWRFYRRFGLSVDFSWGLTALMKSDFKTVDQTLYPLYGRIGLFYKLN